MGLNEEKIKGKERGGEGRGRGEGLFTFSKVAFHIPGGVQGFFLEKEEV